ncbi:hypothetical protein BRW65_28925 [Mycobacterium paraffinicum]|uniref:PPE-PPW subfamily C-terminal domain-containing protein n=2 Tax=Mycobacterium paraffinicum TaxID=53378 RepID=A0A1Q4HB04_9MYCO|nr:hypothetical protein BRW65_28925 [Mycobacterium paraffinicum]
MPGLAYLVGQLTADARGSVSARARARRAAQPDLVEVPAAAAAQAEASQARRRRADVTQLGRRYEYLDAEPSASASDRGAETLGFAGTAPAKRAAAPAGLTALGDDAFDGAARTPMLPHTWDYGPSAP